MTTAPTPRQREVLDYIIDCIEDRNYGPTVREIADEFGITSPNGVVGHLKALEKKGFIHRARHKSRAIELTSEFQDTRRGLPYVGQVAAGPTTLAFEQPDRIDLADFFNRDDLFVLKVRGDSMIDAQIADGDYVVVKKQVTARTGQMVVAQTDEGEATLKFWHPEARRIRLQPANASYDPIYVKRAKVLGVVVGLVRSL